MTSVTLHADGTTTRTTTCTYCGSEFPVSPHSHIWPQWCSQRCRVGSWRLRQADGSLPRETDHSPMEWDESTLYSQVRAQQYPYTRHCLLCGRESATEWLTHERAGMLGRAGLPNCSVCGGWMHMDPLETSGASSAVSAAPRRTVAEPVHAVPRRSA